jgi:hypothetical protein
LFCIDVELGLSPIDKGVSEQVTKERIFGLEKEEVRKN